VKTISGVEGKQVLVMIERIESDLRKLRLLLGGEVSKQDTDKILDMSLPEFFALKPPVQIYTMRVKNVLFRFTNRDSDAFKTVRGMVECGETRLTVYRGLGKKSVEYIKSCLADRGITLWP